MPAIARDDFANAHRDWLTKNWSGINEGVELAVFATGIDFDGKIAQQLAIVLAPGKIGSDAILHAR